MEHVSMTNSIGVYGTGAVAKRAVNRFLTAHLDGEKGRFIFLVDDTWDTTHDLILDYATAEQSALCIVATGDEFVADAKADGIPVQESDDPYNDFIELLQAEKADLVLLWKDDDPEAEEALTDIATDANALGLAVFDLVHGMRQLELAPEEVAPEPEPTPEPQPEEPEEEEDAYEAFLDAIDAADSPDVVLDVFLGKGNRDHLVTLGTAIGADFKVNAWQKRIAPEVHERLMNLYELTGPALRVRDIIAEQTGETVEAPFVDVAPEELVEAVLPPEPEAPFVDVEEDHPLISITVAPEPNDEEVEFGGRWERQDLRHDLASVAAGQGVAAAQEFYLWLQAEGLA
jgi:hypothetical protein